MTVGRHDSDMIEHPPSPDPLTALLHGVRARLEAALRRVRADDPDDDLTFDIVAARFLVDTALSRIEIGAWGMCPICGWGRVR